MKQGLLQQGHTLSSVGTAGSVEAGFPYLLRVYSIGPEPVGLG